MLIIETIIVKLFHKLRIVLSTASFWGYLAVILAIVLPWFFRPGYLFFTDNVWGPIIRFDWFSSWLWLKLLLSGLSFIFPVAFLEKIFIAGVLTLILLGGRILVKKVLEYYPQSDNAVPKASSGLIFILSLFALFNPFIYDRALYGQFGLLIAYGFFLFTLAYLFAAGRTLDFKNLIRAAVCGALVIMFSLHFIFLLLPFILLFAFVLFQKRRHIIAAGKSKSLWRALLWSFLVIIIINANWLIALATKASPLVNFMERGITSQDLVAFQTAGQNGSEALTNVLMMSGFWGKEQFRYLDLTDVVGWQMSFIFLLPLIIYGAYQSFRRRSQNNKLFNSALLLIFILAVFLALGLKSSVTRGLTLFLYDHLPLYKGLREPQKWVAVLIPIYLFYLTLGAYYFSRARIILHNRLVSGLILTVIVVMGAPSLLWGFNRQVPPTLYPSDWYEVNNFLLNHSSQSYGCNDKILFLPWHMYLSFNWVGKIITNPAKTFFSCPVVSGTNMEWGGIYDNSRNKDSQIISAWLSNQGEEAPPLVSGPPLRYIILAKELDFTAYLWLNNLSYLQPLLETKTLLVYEIKS